jgi:tetratricopeptide (TPR) repeat protein
LFNIAFSQCPTFDNHPKGRDYAQYLYEQYRFHYKTKEYKKAFPVWQELYNCCAGERESLYMNGTTIYSFFAENATSEIEKKAYRKKVIELYRGRIQCIENKPRRSDRQSMHGFTYYRIGVKYLQLKNLSKAIEAFDKAIKVDSIHVSKNLYLYYSTSANILKQEDKLTFEETFKIFDHLYHIIEQRIAKYPSDSLEYIRIKNEIKADDSRYRGDRFFTCEYFSNKWLSDFERHKDDEVYLCNELLRKLIKVNCSEKDTLVKQVLERLDRFRTIRDCGFDPPPRNSMIDYYNNCSVLYSIIDIVETYFKNPSTSDYSQEKVYKGAFRLASVFVYDKKWEKALQYYQYATQIDTTKGEPYLRIASLYLIANRKCPSIERQKIISISLDYLEKAMKYPDSKQEAKKRIKLYQSLLPDANMSYHSPYYKKWRKRIKSTVGCVLKEETVVRFAE